MVRDDYYKKAKTWDAKRYEQEAEYVNRMVRWRKSGLPLNEFLALEFPDKPEFKVKKRSTFVIR